MANELTEHFDIPKPNPAHNINDDVVPLGVAFDMVDAALHAQALAIAAKAGAIHGHGIGEIDGLADALASKMAADETFTLAELTDVVGADTALNNYILTKVDGVYAFRAALSVLGEHGHDIDQVTGLPAALGALAPKLNAELTGSPTTTTPAPGDDSTRIANTAFVQAGLLPKAPKASPQLSGDIFLNGRVRGTATAVAASDINLSLGNRFTKTINAATTFTFSNVPVGWTAFTVRITHTSGSITWPASVKPPKNGWPTLTAGKTHLFMFETDDGGATWRSAVLRDYDG